MIKTKVKNIAIKMQIKEIEKITDYYEKVKRLSELAGLVAFYAHTESGKHEDINKCEKMAIETINQLLNKYKL